MKLSDLGVLFGTVAVLTLLLLWALNAGCSLGRIFPAAAQASHTEATKFPVTADTDMKMKVVIPPAVPGVPGIPAIPQVPEVPDVLTRLFSIPGAVIDIALTQHIDDKGATGHVNATAAQTPGAEGQAVEQVPKTPPTASVSAGGVPTATAGLTDTKAGGSGGLGGLFTPTNLLCAIGAFALLAGGILIFALKLVTPGIAVAAVGGVLISAGIAAQKYPWVFAVALGIFVLAGVFLLLSTRKATTAAAATQTALNTTTAGVQAFNNQQADALAAAGVVSAAGTPLTGNPLLQTALALAGTPKTNATIEAIKATPVAQKVIEDVQSQLARVPSAALVAEPADPVVPVAK